MQRKTCLQSPLRSWPSHLHHCVTACAILALAMAPAHGLTLEFAPAVNSRTIDLTINDDTIAERDESIVFEILPDAGYTTGTPAQHTYTIEDDDLPAVSFQAGLPAGGPEDAEDILYVTITGATQAAYPITIDATGTGGATQDADYTITPVTIPADTPFAAAYPIAHITDDGTGESTETVTLELVAAPGDFTLGVAQHSYAITDDEGKPAVTYTTLHGDAGPEGDEDVLTYQIQLSHPMDSTLTVHYQFSGTAQEGTDFTDTTGGKGAATFEPGQTRARVSPGAAP
jgi:hypothetical protein